MTGSQAPLSMLSHQHDQISVPLETFPRYSLPPKLMMAKLDSWLCSEAVSGKQEELAGLAWVLGLHERLKVTAVALECLFCACTQDPVRV